MDAYNKYVICSKCRYFPTKTDQQTTKQLYLTSQSIKWVCQACQFQNIFPRDSVIMLPDRSYLRFPSFHLLSSNSANKKYRLLVVLQGLESSMSQKVVYTPPVDKETLEEEVKMDCKVLLSLEELESQSEWLKFYRKKKGALLKFGDKKIQGKKIFADEYQIFLLERYLKKQILSLTKNKENIIHEVDIIVQAKGIFFYFSIKNIDIVQGQASLQRFLLIYLLNVLELRHCWLSQLYQQQIQFHLNKLPENLQYQRVAIFRQSQTSESSIIISKQPNISISNILTNLQEQSSFIFKKQNFDYFDIYPLSKSSFFKETQSKPERQIRVVEQIDIFCGSRRKKVVQKITVKQNFDSLRKVLINPQNFKTENEQEETLKQISMQIIESLNYKIFLKPVKIIGNFFDKGRSYIVFYSFTEKKKMEDANKNVVLEEPNEYPDNLREEALGVKSQEVKNPFAKKKKKVEIIEVGARVQKNEENDYISL